MVFQDSGLTACVTPIAVESKNGHLAPSSAGRVAVGTSAFKVQRQVAGAFDAHLHHVVGACLKFHSLVSEAKLRRCSGKTPGLLLDQVKEHILRTNNSLGPLRGLEQITGDLK
jgi:hypothetical protein